MDSATERVRLEGPRKRVLGRAVVRERKAMSCSKSKQPRGGWMTELPLPFTNRRRRQVVTKMEGRGKEAGKESEEGEDKEDQSGDIRRR